MASALAAISIGTGRTAVHRVWTPAAILLALLLLGVWAMRPTLRADVSPDRIRPFANLPYTVPVPTPGFPYVVPGDSLARLERSRLVLYENGTRLGPAHARHDLIRDVGQGAYSHWGRTLIFSASDNTDPRTNGRRYSLEVTAEPSPAVLWPGLLLLLGAGIVRLRRWPVAIACAAPRTRLAWRCAALLLALSAMAASCQAAPSLHCTAARRRR